MSYTIQYLNWTFPPDKIRAGNLYLAASLLSSSLEVNTLTAEVACADPAILDFARNTPLRFLPPSGRPMIFRVQSVTRTGPELYALSATSTLGLLTEGLHYGGIYTGQTAGAVIADICGPVPCAVKHNLEGIKLYGWLPIAAPRDNLAQVLFAIGAALKTDLGGVLRIQGLWDGISGQVDRDLMYMDAAADYAAKVTQVIVTEHQYVPWTEEKQLFEGAAQSGDIITFGEPMHALTASGFTILASGANWAKVSAGSGVLTGKTYLHNTRQITKDVYQARDPNVKTVQDATLVSLVNSQAAAERLARYYRCREVVDAPVVYLGEQPGDRLAVWHPFDKAAVDACLESADISLSNTLKAQERSLVGFVPEQGINTRYYDTLEIISTNRTWTVPEGVESVRAVLIGGGSGGTSGGPGGRGGSGSRGTSESDNGSGGNGGTAGSGGAGGRIFQADIELQAGAVFRCVIGAGGAPGGAGGNTTFGQYSSSSGSVSSAGYLEQTTGTVYAAPGEAGIAGGNGSGGTAAGTTVVYDGVSYTPGARGSSITLRSSNTYGGGGSGGGAAAGANGGRGEDGEASTQPFGTGGAGGTGASATIAGKNGAVFGQGGSGGHGGGGGGGGGACYCGAGSSSEWKGQGGAGGGGSAGGSGAGGCIILYYSVPETIPSGQLVDRTNKMLLDRLGRRIVV